MKHNILENMVALTFVMWAGQASAAENFPTSMSVPDGSFSGNVADLKGTGSKTLKLYTDNNGNLEARFVLSTSGLGSGLSLLAGFKQDTSSDVFTFQVLNASGAAVTIGKSNGSTSFSNLTFAVPASAVVGGQVTVQIISSADANNCALDLLALSASGSTGPTPTPTPMPTPKPTPVPTPVPTPGPTPTPAPTPVAGSWWKPTSASEWQWELDHPLDITSASDMGTGVTAYNGDKAPSTNPTIYDIDGFDNPATTVASLHAMGMKVTCYIEVGSAENYRSDYSEFPAAALGKTMPGYSAEKYVDIRNATVVSIIKARIAMCASKGFDAIEPDIDESYGANTGFPLTKADEEAYMTELADYAHSLGVAMWGKNPDDTGDSYAQDMVNVFDAVLTEQCNQYGTCSLLSGYKAVFNAEYQLTTAAFCPEDNARAGWNGVLFNVNLTGSRSPCQ